MYHYDIFRHHLAIKFPAYGHALWEPDPGNLYPAVEVGDVGYICEGRFHRLFNVLLPANHPTHRNFGVPEYHEQLTLNMEDHINIGRLSPNNFCSAKVTSMPDSESKRLASEPETPKVTFWCGKKEGAVLCLPVPAKVENTVASADFGRWIVKHIDRWFVWARQLGLGIDRMEDIILVTGTHCSRSWTNVVFPGCEAGGQTSFGAKVDHCGDIVAINWQFSHERNRGAVLNRGPDGMDLPEDQCIFVRGFRATRRLGILPPRLKAAAGPNPDPEGYDEEPDAQLMPVPALPEYQDPLHMLLEYIAEGASLDCDLLLVHDDDFVRLAGIYDSTPLAALRLDVVLSHLRNLKPILHFTRIDLSSACNNASVDTESASAWVATLSNILDKQLDPSSTPSTSQSPHVKISSTTRELSPSSASLRDDLLQPPTSAAPFPQQNVSGAAGTLSGHATDRFVYAQRLGSAHQPESGPLHPLLPSYGETPSREFISPHSSGSERPDPKAYANQTPADSLSLNKNASRNSFFQLSPGSGRTFSTSTEASSTVKPASPAMTLASSTTALVNTSRSTQPHVRVGSIGKSRDPLSPVEAPLVILRVQVISCSNLEAKGRNGYSDPFVVVFFLEKEFKTPVCKRTLNPVYAPKDATFEFPIYMLPLHRLGILNLKFVVWHKDTIGKDFLSKNALPVNEWFKDTVFAFDDPHNRPIHVGLLSSSTTTILHGSMCIKVGFVHPPHSTSPLDFWNIYNTLANRVLPVEPQADHVGVVTLLIWGARELPAWPNAMHIGWDMDPYVRVTVGDEVQSTQVIRHDRNPVWIKQLVFHVHERDLSLPIVLSVFDWDRFSFDDHVGDVKIHISQLVGTTSKDERTTGFSSGGSPTMTKFNNVPLVLNPTRPYTVIPTLTFRAGYQSYDELRLQVGH